MYLKVFCIVKIQVHDPYMYILVFNLISHFRRGCAASVGPFCCCTNDIAGSVGHAFCLCLVSCVPECMMVLWRHIFVWSLKTSIDIFSKTQQRHDFGKRTEDEQNTCQSTCSTSTQFWLFQEPSFKQGCKIPVCFHVSTKHCFLMSLTCSSSVAQCSL